MSKENEKSEMLNLRLSKKRKDGLRASAKRQGTTLSKLVFSNLDTMKVKGIKEGVLTVLDNLKDVDGIKLPKYDLKDGSDGGVTDVEVVSNLVDLMVEATNGLNKSNRGVKGVIKAIRKASKVKEADKPAAKKINTNH